MRHRYRVWLWLAIFAALCVTVERVAAGQASGDQFAGTWTGTWEGGGGSGGFELTLEKGDTGSLGGRVSVTGEPTYQAELTTVDFQDKKMTARYDFPADERAVVVLEAVFDGESAKGTWSLREKGTDNEALNGTWTVRRHSNK